MIDTADALTAFAASAAHAPTLALDTEFMREKTYRAELCLLQLAGAREAVCIDPLALPDLAALVPALTSAGDRQGHARRSPGSRSAAARGGARAAGVRYPDCGGAGGLSRAGRVTRNWRGACSGWNSTRRTRAPTGHAVHFRPSSRNTRSTTCVTCCRCAPACWTRWRRRAASPGSRKISRRSRIADALRVEPEEAWKKVKGLPALDEARQRLAQAVAAWRERRAVERNRPRGWILDDVSLREIVLRLPRSPRGAELAAGDAGVRGPKMRRRSARPGA